MARQVEWIKCNNGASFCNLETVDLSAVTALGVYVIWQAPSGQVIYVGEGLIADRLRDHRNNPEILSRRGNGSLLVTWASVPNENVRRGIERYLGELWNPPLSARFFTSAPSVEVNLPT